MHSLGIVQWNSTRRDHQGYPGKVSGTGPVIPCRISLNSEVVGISRFSRRGVSDNTWQG